MGHVEIPVDGLPTVIVACVLVCLTSLYPIIKHFLLAIETHKEAKEAVNDPDVIEFNSDHCVAEWIWRVVGATFSAAYCGLGLSFILLFWYRPYTHNIVFDVLWIVWVLPVSFFFPLSELFRFWTAKNWAEVVTSYELQPTGHDSESVLKTAHPDGYEHL